MAHAGRHAEAEIPSVGWPLCWSDLFGLFAEKLLAKTPGPLEAFLGEDHRLRFAARICDSR
jgi:hypothetical protein